MPLPLTPFQVSFLVLVSIHSLTFLLVAGKANLLSSWVAAAVGFGLGQFAAERFFTNGPIMFGSVYVLETAAAAWMAMTIVQRATR